MSRTGRALVKTREDRGALWIVLDRPQRHNSLVPELIDDLRAALAEAVRATPAAIVLTGAGPSFSTGGDLAGFLAHADDPAALAAYADGVVAALNAAILDLVAAPMPLIAAVNGPVTGGALGLVLAADLVAMSESAFLQPYYSEVGFAPDGGWTALLPERIGAARAAEILLRNRRVAAQEALTLGIAHAVTGRDELTAAVSAWIDVLAAGERESLGRTRRLLWDGPRLDAVRARLEAERRAFVDLVGRPVVAERMRRLTESFKKKTA